MGFNFTLDVESLGNIKKAKINVKPLTIIAGENSSGKTFVTKSLYTILNSLVIPHFIVQFEKRIIYFSYSFRRFVNALSSPASVDTDFFDYIEDLIELIDEMISVLSESNIIEQEEQISLYLEEIYIMENNIDDYILSRSSVQRFQKVKSNVDDFTMAFSKIKEIFEDSNVTVVDSISESLSEGLKKNFQITNLSHLINRSQSKNAKVEIDTVGKVELKKDASLHFSFTSSGISEVQKLSNIVFFDSPIYMKIRKALQSTNRKNRQFGFRLSKDDKYLKGYPEYIEELYQYADREYIDTPVFDDISKEIQEAIDGKLIVSKGGDIIYKDLDGNEIPLSLTAMGIGNIGTIDLLIRNNIINKGSFLIMDEPEVHLHPEWQVKLANILYELAKNGVNVVIATHSLDFLKAFQIICSNNPEEAESIIAFNKMPYSQKFSKLTEVEKVSEILDDLSRPFYNLYMQDI